MSRTRYILPGSVIFMERLPRGKVGDRGWSEG